MPPWHGKLSEEQVRGLVDYVRSFAPTPGKSRLRSRNEPAADDFDERFHRLQERMDELRKQYREQADVSPSGVASKTSGSEHHEVTQKSAPAAPGETAIRELFQKHCAKCHGADGTGKRVRDDMPEIPNFTSSSWQARRTDARLIANILDGKGEEMPSWRGKITEEQARALVAHIRSFARATKPTGPGQQEDPPSAGPEETKPPRGRFQKMIRWLGNFHPATVHFPIALLTAATVSELMRMATGKTTFHDITRYCVWFGTLTAGIAGVLGWFLAGFHITDESWVLMMHRWLGTTTVACAALVLALSEAGRPPARGRTRIGFRVALLAVALLVAVTGFFGGAVVYGLDHYAWPR